MSPKDQKALNELDRLSAIHEAEVSAITKRLTPHLVALKKIKEKRHRIHTRNNPRQKVPA